MAESLNFSDFEKILKEEKIKIEKNINFIKAEIEALTIEDEIDDDVDMAELQIDNTADQRILHKLEAESLEIDAALLRIKTGTYGICEKTGKPIPVARLKINPSARTAI